MPGKVMSRYSAVMNNHFQVQESCFITISAGTCFKICQYHSAYIQLNDQLVAIILFYQYSL